MQSCLSCEARVPRRARETLLGRKGVAKEGERSSVMNACKKGRPGV